MRISDCTNSMTINNPVYPQNHGLMTALSLLSNIYTLHYYYINTMKCSCSNKTCKRFVDWYVPSKLRILRCLHSWVGSYLSMISLHHWGFTCNRYHTKQIQSTVNFQRTTHGSRALMASRALMTTTNLISIKHKREKATIKSNDLRKSKTLSRNLWWSFNTLSDYTFLIKQSFTEIKYTIYAHTNKPIKQDFVAVVFISGKLFNNSTLHD